MSTNAKSRQVTTPPGEAGALASVESLPDGFLSLSFFTNDNRNVADSSRRVNRFKRNARKIVIHRSLTARELFLDRTKPLLTSNARPGAILAFALFRLASVGNVAETH